VIRCKECTRLIDDDSNYCKYCGLAQETEEEWLDNKDTIIDHRGKGKVEIKTGNYKMAIGHFDEIIKLDPFDHYAWALKGHCYRHLGEFQKALDSYNKAIEINPKNDDIFFYRDLVEKALKD
jgi:tetratricopeptide (TPR) repeat protein